MPLSCQFQFIEPTKISTELNGFKLELLIALIAFSFNLHDACSGSEHLNFRDITKTLDLLTK